jgi:hypothetical protein
MSSPTHFTGLGGFANEYRIFDASGQRHISRFREGANICLQRSANS